MAASVPRLNFDQVVDRLRVLRKPFHKDYLAMYSGWFGGITTDPALMTTPMDDHLVHRGDGVFEAFKAIDWKVYALERHLDRLERSAGGSFLSLPAGRPELTATILETIRAANVPDCVVRVFVSRGPGGFSVNPYECPASQLYIVVTRFHAAPAEKYESGVILKTSAVPMKKAYLAGMKNCNYLPNVLMKKEAVDAGVDYAVSVDEEGFLGEGATENIGLLTAKGELLAPRFDRVLRGITVSRIMELAGALVSSGDLTAVAEADITPAQAHESTEFFMFGTSFDVLPVVEYDGRSIGDGRPGPIFRKLLDLVRKDIASCPEMLTRVRN